MTTNKTRTRKLVDAEKAFAFWEANSFHSKTEICQKFTIQLDDLGYWMKQNGKKRPDGRILGKESPRQIALKELITVALQEGKSLEWVYVEMKKANHGIGKGDIRYFTMKNNLPSLREDKPIVTSGGKYG